MNQSNVPLHVAVCEALREKDDSAFDDPQRFVSYVMDVTNPDDSVIVVFTNNCDGELLEPLRGFLRNPSSESAGMAALRIEDFLAGSRMVQQMQAHKVACNLVFGTCTYAKVAAPEAVALGALGEVPSPAVLPPDFIDDIPTEMGDSGHIPPIGGVPPEFVDPFVEKPAIDEREHRKHRARRVPLIVLGAVLLLIVAVMVGAFAWRGHVRSAAAGTWMVSDVKYGEVTDTGFWAEYCEYSRYLELEKNGGCTYSELPLTWEGTWTAGLPLFESAVTLDLPDKETMEVGFEDDRLVLRDGQLTITFIKDESEPMNDESQKYDTGQVVGMWQIVKTVKDGTTVGEKEWNDARREDKNITLRLGDDRTFEWRISDKQFDDKFDGTWKMVDDGKAVFATDEGDAGLITVSDEGVLRFAFSDDNYGEYHRVE